MPRINEHREIVASGPAPTIRCHRRHVTVPSSEHEELHAMVPEGPAQRASFRMAHSGIGVDHCVCGGSTHQGWLTLLDGETAQPHEPILSDVHLVT